MLKKTYTVFFLFVFVFVLTGCSQKQTSPEITEEQKQYKVTFRESSWGMTKQEVAAVEKNKQTDEAFFENGTSIVIYPGTVMDMLANIGYMFTESDELYIGSYTVLQYHTDNKDYYSDYKAIQDELISLYGEPETATENWTKEGNKGNKGESIVNGTLSISSTWDVEGIKILHSITYNAGVEHMVIYQNQELAETVSDKGSGL